MLNRRIVPYVISIIAIGISSCTSQPVETPPGDYVMPFPLHMALKDNVLLVGGVNADNRFSHGRLVALDTEALDKVLKSDAPKYPISLQSVLSANMLIPTASSMMAVKDDIFFASPEGRLYKVPMTPKGFVCNRAQSFIEGCKDVKSLDVGHTEPLALQIISKNPEILAISFSSSSRISLVSLSTMTPKKSFDAYDFLHAKGIKISAEERVLTKKILVEKKDTADALVYFLLERRSIVQISPSPQGAYLVAIKQADLLTKDTIPASLISLWDFKDLFSIVGVHDIFVDESNKMAYLLGQSPEILFKINLTTSVLIDTAPACVSASSLTVSVAQNRIVMPCFKDNRIASFTMSPLALDITSKIYGQGPSYVVIDENKNYIYVSFFNDGRVVIFDNQLNYLGHVFDATTVSDMGS